MLSSFFQYIKINNQNPVNPVEKIVINKRDSPNKKIKNKKIHTKFSREKRENNLTLTKCNVYIERGA